MGACPFHARWDAVPLNHTLTSLRGLAWHSQTMFVLTHSPHAAIILQQYGLPHELSIRRDPPRELPRRISDSTPSYRFLILPSHNYNNKKYIKLFNWRRSGGKGTDINPLLTRICHPGYTETRITSSLHNSLGCFCVCVPSVWKMKCLCWVCRLWKANLMRVALFLLR